MTGEPGTSYRWNAFISYSQDPDRAFAQALRDALHRFAKPVFALRRTNIFLDVATLAPEADLPGRLRGALEQSEHLILLAHPRSAASRWVAQEVQHWIASKGGVSKIVLVRTGGTIAWGADGDFDWAQTDALPRTLAGCYRQEPLWLDASRFRSLEDFQRSPDFVKLVASIASVLLGRPLDELIGEDVAGRRRLNALRNAAIAGLSVLTLAATGLGVMAEINRRSAVEAGTRALERALAVTAMSAMEGDPGLEASQKAAAMSLQANSLQPSPQAWLAASRALARLPDAVVERQTPIETALLRPGMPQFAVVTRDGLVSLHGLDGKEAWRTQLSDAGAAAWSPSGRALAVAGKRGRLALLAATGAVEAERVIEETDSARDDAEGHEDVKLLGFVGETTLLIVRRNGLAVLDTEAGRVTTRRVHVPLSRAVLCGTAVAWGDGQGQVWVAPLGLDQPARLVHKHADHVESLACAADGGSVASSGWDDVVHWTRGEATRQSRHAGWSTVTLSQSGRHMAVLSMEQGGSSFSQRDGTNETWLFSADSEAPVWHNINAYQSDRAVFVGETLIAADEPRALVRVDPGDATRAEQHTLRHQVDFLATRNNGEGIVFVSGKGVVGVVDATTGHARRLAQLPGIPLTLDLSRDGALAVTVANRDAAADAGFRRVVALTRLDALGGIVELPSLGSFAKDADGSIVMGETFPGAVARARLTPYGRHVVWRSKGAVERITSDVRTGTICAYAGDAGITVLSRDGKVLWQQRGLRLRGEGRAFSRDSAYLALANDELELDLRHAADGARATPDRWAAAKSSIWQLSPDARFVAMAVDNETVRLMSREDTAPLLEYRPNNSYALAFDPGGRWFAGVDEGNVLTWMDLASRQRQRFVLTQKPMRHELMTVSNGTSLLLIGSDSLSRLDLPGSAAPGRETTLVSGKIEDILATSADDRQVAVSMSDNSVRVVETSGAPAVWSTEFGQRATSGAFDAAGRRLALASADGDIRVYDLRARKLLIDMRTSIGVIGKLAFVESDGWLLAEGQSGGMAVRIDPFEALCRRAGRPLDQETWSGMGGLGRPAAVCPGW
jgi:hypothetical protein